MKREHFYQVLQPASFLAFLSSHGITWSIRFPKKNIRTLFRGLQYLGAHLHNEIFCIKFNAFKIFLYNVLLFLNLAMDLYYIHNLHTYTKYRKKMVKRRYKRGRSLGIFRSITIYFHNWKHHSIGYQPKLSRLLFTSTGINKTTLISFIKHGTQQRC